jgi:hypothetical protein
MGLPTPSNWDKKSASPCDTGVAGAEADRVHVPKKPCAQPPVTRPTHKSPSSPPTTESPRTKPRIAESRLLQRSQLNMPVPTAPKAVSAHCLRGFHAEERNRAPKESSEGFNGFNQGSSTYRCTACPVTSSSCDLCLPVRRFCWCFSFPVNESLSSDAHDAQRQKILDPVSPHPSSFNPSLLLRRIWPLPAQHKESPASCLQLIPPLGLLRVSAAALLHHEEANIISLIVLDCLSSSTLMPAPSSTHIGSNVCCEPI